mmetsp:Transcript_7146/g.18526  ORF Transcript_7146/g.18526 Transcript_7146/m.18526 type:complete len:224 (-) Transcript_7146:797-1468(-)
MLHHHPWYLQLLHLLLMKTLMLLQHHPLLLQHHHHLQQKRVPWMPWNPQEQVRMQPTTSRMHKKLCRVMLSTNPQMICQTQTTGNPQKHTSTTTNAQKRRWQKARSKTSRMLIPPPLTMPRRRRPTPTPPRMTKTRTQTTSRWTFSTCPSTPPCGQKAVLVQVQVQVQEARHAKRNVHGSPTSLRQRTTRAIQSSNDCHRHQRRSRDVVVGRWTTCANSCASS